MIRNFSCTVISNTSELLFQAQHLWWAGSQTHTCGLLIGFVRADHSLAFHPLTFCTACNNNNGSMYLTYCVHTGPLPLPLTYSLPNRFPGDSDEKDHVKRSRWPGAGCSPYRHRSRSESHHRYTYLKSKLPISKIDCALGRLVVPSGLQSNLPGR